MHLLCFMDISSCILNSSGKTLSGDEIEVHETRLHESDVPEEIEQVLEELLQSLEDKVNAWLCPSRFLYIQTPVLIGYSR